MRSLTYCFNLSNWRANMNVTSKYIAVSLSAALLFAAPQVGAEDKIHNFTQATPQNTHFAAQSSFDKFAPRPSLDKAKHRIDFSILDIILNSTVLSTGSSARRYAPRVKAPLGTRIKTNVGHTSPYRLEGNKVVFSALDKAYKTALSDYQHELEQVGNEIDISTLPRNQQLAYWFNLHNLTVMDIIAQEYPVRRPRDIRIGPDKTPMHEAKLITIQGTPLSLRDIREKIVFSNWKNPDVIYGFWYGDIGSPSLQGSAFTERNLSQALSYSAGEFTNSLRAINSRKAKLSVSELYYNAAPYYFPNFETDLKTHLRPHLRDDVIVLLDDYSAIKPDKYEKDIADTTGGVGNRLLSGGAMVQRGMLALDEACGGCTTGSTQLTLTSNFNRGSFFESLNEKRDVLRRQGRIPTGTVIITDIETEDLSIQEIE